MRSHAGKMVRVGVTVGRGANSEFHSIEAFCGENLYDVIRRKLCLETRECRLGEWITEVNGEKVHLREDMQGGLQLYVMNGRNEGLPYVNHDNGEFFLSIQQMVVTSDIKVRLAYDPYTVDLPKLAGDGPIVSCVSCNVDMDDSLRKNAEMKYSIDQVRLMTPEIAMLSYAASAQGNADYNFDNSGDGAALAPHIKSAWNAGNAGWETCTGLSKSCAEFDGSRYQCILAQRGTYHVPAYAPHAFAGDGLVRLDYGAVSEWNPTGFIDGHSIGSNAPSYKADAAGLGNSANWTAGDSALYHKTGPLGLKNGANDRRYSGDNALGYEIGMVKQANVNEPCLGNMPCRGMNVSGNENTAYVNNEGNHNGGFDGRGRAESFLTGNTGTKGMVLGLGEWKRLYNTNIMWRDIENPALHEIFPYIRRAIGKALRRKTAPANTHAKMNGKSGREKATKNRVGVVDKATRIERGLPERGYKNGVRDGALECGQRGVGNGNGCGKNNNWTSAKDRRYVLPAFRNEETRHAYNIARVVFEMDRRNRLKSVAGKYALWKALAAARLKSCSKSLAGILLKLVRR